MLQTRHYASNKSLPCKGKPQYLPKWWKWVIIYFEPSSISSIFTTNAVVLLQNEWLNQGTRSISRYCTLPLHNSLYWKRGCQILRFLEIILEVIVKQTESLTVGCNRSPTDHHVWREPSRQGCGDGPCSHFSFRHVPFARWCARRSFALPVTTAHRPFCDDFGGEGF